MPVEVTSGNVSFIYTSYQERMKVLSCSYLGRVEMKTERSVKFRDESLSGSESVYASGFSSGIPGQSYLSNLSDSRSGRNSSKRSTLLLSHKRKDGSNTIS